MSRAHSTWRMTWYDPYHDYPHGSGRTPRDSERHSTRGSAGPGNSARGALARRRDRDRTAAAAGQVRTQAPPSDCAADGQGRGAAKDHGRTRQARPAPRPGIKVAVFALDSSCMVAAVCEWHEVHSAALSEIE